MKKYTLITSFIFVLVLGSGFALASQKAVAVTEEPVVVRSMTTEASYIAAWVGDGRPDTTYTIKIFEGNATNPTFTKKGLKTTSYSATLPSNKIYYYTVNAENLFGISPPSKKVSLKPVVKPSAVVPVVPSTPGTVMIDPNTETITIYPTPSAVTTPIADEGGTVKIDSAGFITITPGAGGITKEETVLLPDTEIFKMMTENNLVLERKAKKILGITIRTNVFETIKAFQEENSLKVVGHNDSPTQDRVNKLIANQKLTPGTVKVDSSVADTITITPSGDAGVVKKTVISPLKVKEVKQISNKMLYNLIIESGLVVPQKSQGVWGFFGIGENSKKAKTVKAFEKQYDLYQTDPNIRAKVLELIKKKQLAGSTGGTVTVDNSGAGTIKITPGVREVELKKEQ